MAKHWKISQYYANMYEQWYGENNVVVRNRVFREVQRNEEYIHLTYDLSENMSIGFSTQIKNLDYMNEVNE